MRRTLSPTRSRRCGRACGRRSRSRRCSARTPPIIGPTARARLAPDCMMPRARPCSCSSGVFDARLVSAGDASELPSDKNADADQQPRRPPESGPDKRHGKQADDHQQAADSDQWASPNRFTSGPNKTPCATIETSPTKANR